MDALDSPAIKNAKLSELLNKQGWIDITTIPQKEYLEDCD